MKNKHYKHLFIVCIALISALSPLRGQKFTDVSSLVTFSEKKLKEAKENRKAAEVFAEMNKLPLSFMDDEGSCHELQSINDDGIPMYYISDNAHAAKTISTSEVQDGGRNDLQLDGRGIQLLLWDAGTVRGTHQEFEGRITLGDSSNSCNAHATHVAGTMIAKGINPQSKGMAYNARLTSYNWNYDISEMAAEAAEGALISNHSYGYGRGWVNNGCSWVWYGNTSISEDEDYLFGFYDMQAQDWDQVAYFAPQYLIVKSAGNDRNEGPGTEHPVDGPFDCLAHAAVAKNVLTVGAVYPIENEYQSPGDVRIADFSSCGPTDDGRIKPDIVTQGISIYSTYDNTDDAYKTLSGTSTAAPSASGSLALLQQLWEDIHGEGSYMLAATLKGLIIHTSDEAGNSEGPDYEYGWGLMNTEKAALKISQNQWKEVITELVLNENETYTRTIKSDGMTPIRVTICWTDAPGTPLAAQLDPETAMLVNDLDLTVIHKDDIYYPWSLNAKNPQQPATCITKNYVDNVEVIDIINPEAGEYTITVTHEGHLLNEHQNFSIIISGMDGSSPPVVDFQANNTEISVGDDVVFECKSKGNPTSWEWTFPGGFPNYSTEKNPVITYTKAGTYKVILTARNNFGMNTKIAEEYITVSDADVTDMEEQEIKAFPNPAINTLNIELTNNNEPVLVRIISSLGTIYKEFNMDINHQSIDVSYFPKGVYYAVVNNNGQTKTCKFLKY